MSEKQPEAAPSRPRFFKPKSLYVRHVKVVPSDPHDQVRTKDDVLFTLLKPVLSARTPEQLQESLMEGTRRMYNTGVFTEVQVQNAIIDNQPVMRNGKLEAASTLPVDVFLAVKESKFQSTVGGDIVRGADSRPEALAKFALAVHNPTGYAETWTASMHRNQHGSDVYSASFFRPTMFGTMRNLKVEAFSDSVNFMARSAFVQQDRGFRCTLGKLGSPHTLSYLAQWRDLLPSLHAPGSIDATASPQVISETAPSFKSALQYKFSRDSRKTFGTPLSGGMFAATTELAGLGGDVAHWRGTITGQYNWTVGRTMQEERARAGKSPVEHGSVMQQWLSPGVTLSLGGSVGALVPFARGSGKTRAHSSVVDRFFMGGNDTLRCFAYAGVGPRAHKTSIPSSATTPSAGSDGSAFSPRAGTPGAGSLHGDALGGDCMWYGTARLMLPPPLPWRPLLNIGARTQLFASIGNVLSTLPSSPHELVGGFRGVAGVGFVLPIPLASSGAACIEINYPIWRKAASKDVVVGLGIGVSF